MPVAQSGVRNVSATYEMSDDPKELELKQAPDSPTSLESDPPDGGFQAWATVFGRYAVPDMEAAVCSSHLRDDTKSFLIQFCGFGYVLNVSFDLSVKASIPDIFYLLEYIKVCNSQIDRGRVDKRTWEDYYTRIYLSNYPPTAIS
jgi:hypothetical protein